MATGITARPRRLQPGTMAGPTTPAQLSLLPESWRLDDRTREIGRRGVASAREALRQARSERSAPGEHTRHAA